MKKKFLLIVLSFSLIAALTACGNQAAGAEPSTAAEASPSSETAEKTLTDPAELYPANINPADIHPGSLNSDEDTSDRWYPNGDTSADLCFTLTETEARDDCVGLSFTLYKLDASGTQVDMADLPLKDGGNGHGITGEFTLMADKNSTYDFDLTFQDNFTCYDFKTDTVWKRSHPEFGCKDQKWYDDAFSGLAAYRDFDNGDSQQILMNDDHTFVESNTDMDDMTGKWEVQASNVLMLIYDNAEDAGLQQVDALALEKDITGESANETTLSNEWQQEFNISGDGKVTEFGLFPVYDDDMNLAGYESAFSLTTKDQIESAKKEQEEKADASKSAGSPYPVPEADNITEYSLDGVNMEQAPDQVIETIVWDDRDAFSKELRDGTHDGYVFEIHGTYNVQTLLVQSEDGEHNYTFNIMAVDDVNDIENGAKVVIKGVIWPCGSTRYLFFDRAHITVSE